MGLLQLSDNGARRANPNKTSHSAKPLESHSKALCNMSNSCASDRSETGEGLEGEGGGKLCLDLCKSDFGSLCNVEKRE